ncbi:MAG: hypothetical protein HKN42_13420 [Granulosicoccus sp.]|nr:hypothetical protein [Granulosicoccus sp.]
MKIHLTSAYATHTGLNALHGYAQIDTLGQHQLCADAAEADAILFVENTQFDDLFFRQLLQHPYIADFSDKVFMYNEMDRPWDVLPGLYCCMTHKHIDDSRHRACAYLYSPNPFVSDVYQDTHETQWLYSFMGSMSHACRRTIMRLRHQDGFVRDTSDFNVWKSDPAELKLRGSAYARTIAASQFVLCPRGIGTSSIRLYETLEAGRVPVIISDDWVAPAETDWSFAVQVEERRVRSVPGLLSAMKNEAEERGEAARKAWLDSYSPNTMFNTVGNSLQVLLQSGNGHRHRRQRTDWNKWISGGELYTRAAAQRLLRHN